MEQKKFSLTIGFVAVFAIGFLAGYYLVGSSVKTSILEAEAEKGRAQAQEEYDAESEFLDDYEVTPEKMAEFVEENPAGTMYEVDGVFYIER